MFYESFYYIQIITFVATLDRFEASLKVGKLFGQGAPEVAEKEWNPPESSGDGSDDEATCVEVKFGSATTAI
jgi:hypothetical protein